MEATTRQPWTATASIAEPRHHQTHCYAEWDWPKRNIAHKHACTTPSPSSGNQESIVSYSSSKSFLNFLLAASLTCQLNNPAKCWYEGLSRMLRLEGTSGRKRSFPELRATVSTQSRTCINVENGKGWLLYCIEMRWLVYCTFDVSEQLWINANSGPICSTFGACAPCHVHPTTFIGIPFDLSSKTFKGQAYPIRLTEWIMTFLDVTSAVPPAVELYDLGVGL